jgi:hypothetical protein
MLQLEHHCEITGSDRATDEDSAVVCRNLGELRCIYLLQIHIYYFKMELVSLNMFRFAPFKLTTSFFIRPALKGNAKKVKEKSGLMYGALLSNVSTTV